MEPLMIVQLFRLWWIPTLQLLFLLTVLPRHRSIPELQESLSIIQAILFT